MSNADKIRRALDDFFAGDETALAALLAADGEWRGVDTPQCECHGRQPILARLRSCQDRRLLTRVVEARDGRDGDVFVRWYGERMQERFDVPDGIASIVVSIADGHITRIQDYAGEQHALAGAGLAA
jgi:ketosteroid isomerase-like protein